MTFMHMMSGCKLLLYVHVKTLYQRRNNSVHQCLSTDHNSVKNTHVNPFTTLALVLKDLYGNVLCTTLFEPTFSSP